MALTNPSPTFPQFPGDAVAVTKSNTTRFPPSVIYVGATGDVSVVTSQGNNAFFKGVPTGAVIPVRVIGVNDTTGGTTSATDMIRIF